MWFTSHQRNHTDADGFSDCSLLSCLQKALHVRALRPFKDAGGRERRTGEEWLVTMADREAHIPSVAEEVVGVVDVTTLSSRQYCVILDPVGPDGKPQLGQKRVVKVRRSFSLAVSSFAAFVSFPQA